ncbi:MAG: Sec-independent protein translocase TatA [Pseudomonadota bacterium]
MSPGLWQILLVVLLVVFLFGGRGKISSLMGDFAKGIKSFREGLKDEEAQKSLNKDGDDAVDVTPQKDKAATE